MTPHRLFALTVAASAIVAAAPVFAQAAPGSEPVFESVPVVQPVPGGTVEPLIEPMPVPEPAPAPVAEPVERVTIYEAAQDVAPAAPMPPLPPVPPVPPVPPAPPAPPAYYGDGDPPPHIAGYYTGPQPDFDRGAWLADCHERIRGVRRDDRARVIGGLLGAVAGGVIGNNVWGSHRLAGTLLGAGVGGLAGAAVGDAASSAKHRKHDDECAYYLDQYMERPQAGPGYGLGAYPAYGYGYGYGYGYAYPAVTYVPVLVQVPQRAVVHEYVTEEVDDVPAPVTRSRTIPRPAPRADKRAKLIRTK